MMSDLRFEIEAVQKYIDDIRYYAEGGDLYIEQKLSYAKYVKNGWGTSDAVIIQGDELQVHDLKFGRGHRVDADNNTQLMLYAVGAYLAFSLIHEIRFVRLVIHQPRLKHLSEWDLSVEDLLAFAERAAEAALATEDPNAPRTPSEEACRWCKAKAFCEDLAAHVGRTVIADFEDISDFKGPVTTVDLEQITPAQIGAILPDIELIEGWLKAVRARAVDALSSGQKIPGWKLVAGRMGDRKWSNETQALQCLLKKWRYKKTDLVISKTKSPTQIEKFLKSKKTDQFEKLKSYITQTPGKSALAPESDPRPSLAETALDEFDSL